MPGALSYDRPSARGSRGDDDVRDTGQQEPGAGRHPHCRYYAATDRSRHRYSSFSIMKWFRRGKQSGCDEDAAWFRDDLKRIRQAYTASQESVYAAVTPIASRRRTAAATWSRWSGSTTTVYSFAYVNGRAIGRDDDDDDEARYADAATSRTPRRRRTDRGRPQSATMTSTMASTARRRNKGLAPPPPAVSAVETTSTARRVARTTTASTGRKKYRAPQPPAAAEPPAQPPQQRPAATRAPYRHKKGPAPKPPIKQQQQQLQHQQQQNQQQQQQRDPAGSNVRRRITQYERDRLMERVDKIEKHFLGKRAAGKRAEEAAERAANETRPRRDGFASAAALYAAMAATNLTELDKRAAEICRRNRLHGTVADGADVSAPAANEPRRPAAVIADDRNNAIVAAVMRKSYPSAAAAAVDGRRSSGVGETTTAADDEKRLVRLKRLDFFAPQRRPVAAAVIPATIAVTSATTAVTPAATAVTPATTAVTPATTAVTPATAAVTPAATAATPAAKCSLGTQTTKSVIAAKTLSRSKNTAVANKSGGERSKESKNLSSEDNKCYQQLMAMEMQSDLVLHNGPFECAVCLCTYDNNGVVLRDCLHVFCRLCLQMTIGHSLAEQVQCPYIDDRYSCTGVLQHREIKKILDSDEEYERFLQRSVERARQLLAKERNGGSFQCARPDCTGWCVIYDKDEVFEFKCPVCAMVTCVRCGSIHAPGKGCQTVENDNGGGDTQDTLEDLIDRGDAMPCPGCRTILSKQQGCDWIKCAVCFMEICWATKGPRWGPKGKGDTSAGCMCGIPPGRKCHTECKYCH